MTNFEDDQRAWQKLHDADKSKLLRMIRGGIGRREFLANMMAAGATAGFAGAAFTGASTAWASTPKRGGRLVVAIDAHGPGDTLDPAQMETSVDYFRGRMVYGSLVRLRDDLSYEPELAEEVLPNEDASVWTFKIRKDVEFHNGKILDADDVIYSMNRHLGEDTISTGKTLVSMIDRWEKVGSHEVRAVLSSPNADLPIALGTFQFKIIPNGWTDFQAPVGTGPYKVAEFRPGVRMIGSRFENYWTDGGYLDEIEHFAIPDSVSRLNAFLAGDVDCIASVPGSAVETVEQAEGKGLWAIESGSYINIAASLDMAPSNNANLVKAMQYLMDRERVVRGVLKGQGRLGNDQPIGPAYFDHCSDIPQRTLDPDMAKFYFEKSGIGSTPVPVVAAQLAQGTVEQATFLQREAAKIGMNIDVKQVSTDGYYAAVWSQVPFFVVRWHMRPTANIQLSLAYHSQAAWNESHWKNEQFDQLLTDVRAVTDAAKRREMYCDMQTMIHETGGTIIPAHLNYVDAAADHVKGRTYVPLSNFGGAESPPFLWRDDA